MIKKIIYFLLIILLWGCNFFQESVNVYFCGGQSNATELWYETIKSRILENDPTAIVLYSSHGASSISTWYDNGPQYNYDKDIQIFYNALDNVNYDIKAFFWFQGETDAGYDYANYYEKRFTGFISQYKYDLKDYNFPIYMIIVDGNNIEVEKIRPVQEKIINENNNIFGLDSRYYKRYDIWHLIESEQIRIGNNIYNLFHDN